MFLLFLLSLRFRNQKLSFMAKLYSVATYGFEPNGTYSISVTNLNSLSVAFGLLPRNEIKNSIFGDEFCFYCYNTNNSSIIGKSTGNNTSVSINGSVANKGIYYLFFADCNYCNMQGYRKKQLILDAELKNENTYLDYRKKNLLVIIPLFSALFGAITVVWFINWIMNIKAKITIHYLFTACITLCFISSIVKCYCLYYEKEHHPSTGIYALECTFRILYLASLFFAIIIASKGWCIIKPTIKLKELIFPLIYIIFMLVFQEIILNIDSGNWDILFLFILVIALVLYVRDLINSINKSSLRVLAHCLSIANKGIDPKSTPIWRKRMMLNNLRTSFCVYCFLLIIRFIFIFFLDYLLWVDEFMSIVTDFAMIIIIAFTFYLRKENTEGYTMIMEGDENEFTLQDLEGVDFNSERIQGGVTWTPGMILPNQPVVIDTPTTVTIESPDGTAEVNAQHTTIDQNREN